MDISQKNFELIAPRCDANVVYCSGSFNEWNTNSGVVTLEQKAPGYYVGSGEWPTTYPIEYKYHLGNWQSEELDEWGSLRENRVLLNGQQVRDHVPQFLNAGAYHRETYLPRIEMLPPNLPVPAPFATRRVAALLPANYDRSGRRYPVLYLQDGQNLFDEYAPYGNWELDKRLAWLAERGCGDFIVVAIDHAKDKRLSEYSSPKQTKLAPGAVDAYGKFLVGHLKPLIDRTYRTLTDRAHTAIGGSSMGALASMYVAIAHPDVFGKAMLLSPSIWVDQQLTETWPQHAHGDTRIYLYGGMEESKGSAVTFARLAEAIRRCSSERRPIHLRSHFLSSGQHNEAVWGRIFPRAAAFLFH